MTSEKSLMIVDDSKVSRMMITAIIKEKTPELLLYEASNADEALSLSKGKNINFFSVDYNMPGKNGMDLILELKKIFPDSRFALLTANIQTAIHEKSKSIGATCINKPISDESIESMLEFFYGN